MTCVADNILDGNNGSEQPTHGCRVLLKFFIQIFRPLQGFFCKNLHVSIEVAGCFDLLKVIFDKPGTGCFTCLYQFSDLGVGRVFGHSI